MMRNKQDKNASDQRVPCCYQPEDRHQELEGPFDVLLEDECDDASETTTAASSDPVTVQFHQIAFNSDMDGVNKGTIEPDMIKVATVKKSNTLACGMRASCIHPVTPAQCPVCPGLGVDDLHTSLAQSPSATSFVGELGGSNMSHPTTNEKSPNQKSNTNNSSKDYDSEHQIPPDEPEAKGIHQDFSKENDNNYNEGNLHENPSTFRPNRKAHKVKRVRISPGQDKQPPPRPYGRAHWDQLSADRLHRNRGGPGGGTFPRPPDSCKKSKAPAIPPRVFLTESTIEEDSEPSHEDEVLKAHPGESNQSDEEAEMGDKFDPINSDRCNLDNKKIDITKRSTWTGRLATPDNVSSFRLNASSIPPIKEEEAHDQTGGADPENEVAHRIFNPERMSTRLTTPDNASRVWRGSSYTSRSSSQGSTDSRASSNSTSSTIYANTSDPGAPEPAYANVFESVVTEPEDDKYLRNGEPIYATLGNDAETSDDNHSSSSASTLCPDNQQKSKIQAKEKLIKERNINSPLPLVQNRTYIDKPYHTVPRLPSEQRSSDIHTDSVPRDYGLKIRIVGRSRSHSDKHMTSPKRSPPVPLISSYSSSSSSSSSYI
ncbi:unnamed protein product, partial [Meganyctiphanes norvegica]